MWIAELWRRLAFLIGRKRFDFGWQWLQEASQDLRYAARIFTSSPGFTLVAALTLALGVGANTAVFSIVDAVLLRPLPYKDPGRLVAIWDRGVHEKELAKLFDSYSDFDEWSRSARSFESVAAATWATPGRILTGHGAAEEILAVPVSLSFFDTLRAEAALGRTFNPDDEKNGCSVVLSDRFWRKKLAADPSLVGQSLTLDRSPCTIVGVMPRGFAFYPDATQMWILLGPDFQPDRQKMVVGVFARLNPGVTIEQAQSEVAALHEALHKADGRERDISPVVYGLQGEFTWLANRNLRTTLAVLSGAVLFVLLIGCLNVANLLLGRAFVREREFAVRAALGCGRSRMMRQLLTEGLLLSGIGGLLGVLVAYGAVRYFRAVNPVELPVGAEVAINIPALVFTGLISICATLLFGMMPAVRTSGVDVNEGLKAGARGAIHGGPAHWVANTLVIAEVALSVVLLVGAGLLMASAFRMESAELGFNPEHLVITKVSLPADSYKSPQQRYRYYEQALRRLDQMPGSSGSALSSNVAPYGGGNQTIEIEGQPVPAGTEIHDVAGQTVSPSYFQVMKVPLQRGRVFDSRDRSESEQAAIVNEALVREYFPRTDPIGKHIRLGDGQNQTPWLNIVGVVGNEKHSTLLHEMSWTESPVVFRPVAQEPRPSLSIVVRTAGEPARIGEEIQRALAGIDGSAPIQTPERMRERLSKSLAYPHFRAIVFTSLALCALILAGVGLHGVLGQFVAQRTREFGLRMAVGAGARDVFLLVARQGGVPVLVGLGIGVCAGLALSRLLTSLLYGVQSADPVNLILMSLALFAVAAIAIASPAMRAAKVDPIIALRAD